MIRSFFIVIVVFLLVSHRSSAQVLTIPQQQVDTEREYIRANQLKLIGKTDEALKIFEDIVRKDKRNHAAFYEIARIYEAKQDWLNAEKAIANAVRINPREPWYFVKQVDILEEQNKLDAAAKVFEELIPLRPDQQALYTRWAQILTNAGQDEKAIDVLNEEEARFGKNLGITEAKVSIYKKEGEKEEVIAEWQRLHETFPNEKDYLKRQVDELVEQGRFDDLEPLYKKILEIDPYDSETKIKLAKVNAKDLSRNDQLEALDPMIDDRSINAEQKIRALLPFIEILASTQDSTMAADLLDKAEKLTEMYPENAMAHALLADIHNQNGDMQNAADAYARTIELDISNAVVWEQYLFALSETQQYEKLLSASEEAIDLFPNRSEFFLLNGTALMADGNWEDAIDLTDQALLRSGRNTIIKLLAYTQMSRAYHMNNDRDKRDQSLQGALGVNDRYLPALKLLLGFGLVDNALSEDWKNIMSTTLARYPGDPTLQLFSAMSKQSIDSRGVFTEETLPGSCLDDGKCLEWLALWCEGNNMATEAKKWWEKASLTPTYGPETSARMKELTGGRKNN